MYNEAGVSCWLQLILPPVQKNMMWVEIPQCNVCSNNILWIDSPRHRMISPTLPSELQISLVHIGQMKASNLLEWAGCNNFNTWLSTPLKDGMSFKSLGVWLNHTHGQTSSQVVAMVLIALCQQVIEHCQKGWPRKWLVKPDIALYWKFRGSLKVCN